MVQRTVVQGETLNILTIMSMHIERFVCNAFQENCYVVSDDTNEAIIIDCGAFYEEERKAVVSYVRTNNLKVKHLVATHGHVDHNFGNDTIKAEFGLLPEVHRNDEPLMQILAEQAKAFAGITIDNSRYSVGRYFGDDDIISFGSHTFTIIPTPGHSPGSVFLYCEQEKLAFSGDTLFRMSIGRTDFDYGSFSDIVASLRKVASSLPPETTVLPGHGPQTTMAYETANNPYLK